MLATVVEVRGHAPRDVGAKMVVTAAGTWDTIGGGNLEATVVRRARELLTTGATAPEHAELGLSEHATTEFGRQCCGGRVTVLLEPVPTRPTVAVFGLGHVGAELALILSRHPLRLVLADSRAARVEAVGALLPNDGRADVALRHAPAPERVLAGLPPGALVYVMTHDHAEDLVLCDAALHRHDLGPVGLIGSRAKRARFLRHLGQLGHEDATDRLRCPIGAPGVTGKDPAVLAVAVAAEIVSSTTNRRGPIHHPTEDGAVGVSRPPGGGGGGGWGVFDGGVGGCVGGHVWVV